MKVSTKEIGGVIVKQNDTYLLEDNNRLEHLTLSKTTLNPGMSTNGHSHEHQEEVYLFKQGKATIVVGKESNIVVPGDIVLIPKGQFHRVINMSTSEPCVFVCVFEKYDRASKDADYTK